MPAPGREVMPIRGTPGTPGAEPIDLLVDLLAGQGGHGTAGCRYCGTCCEVRADRLAWPLVSREPGRTCSSMSAQGSGGPHHDCCHVIARVRALLASGYMAAADVCPPGGRGRLAARAVPGSSGRAAGRGGTGN